MEVKVKNSELAGILVNLVKINTEDVSGGSQLRIQKLIKIINELHLPYGEILSKSALSHGGTKNEEQGYVSFDMENQKKEYEDFMLENKELNEQESTVIFDPIDFTKVEHMKFNLSILSPFFENYN